MGRKDGKFSRITGPVVQKEDNALHWMNLCPQYLSAG